MSQALVDAQGVISDGERNVFRFSFHQTLIKHRNTVRWWFRDARGELHSGVAVDLRRAEETAAAFGYRRKLPVASC